jgi:NAD(P)-dependent dehydrogenase (short-subunit alcohol dehydrogenase family)
VLKEVAGKARTYSIGFDAGGFDEIEYARIAAKRFGTPEEFADACAFLCSAQAGFISGQNLQLDGGSYHGLL